MPIEEVVYRHQLSEIPVYRGNNINDAYDKFVCMLTQEGWMAREGDIFVCTADFNITKGIVNSCEKYFYEFRATLKNTEKFSKEYDQS